MIGKESEREEEVLFEKKFPFHGNIYINYLFIGTPEGKRNPKINSCLLSLNSRSWGAGGSVL